jgi:hypothetical protein
MTDPRTGGSGDVSRDDLRRGLARTARTVEGKREGTGDTACGLECGWLRSMGATDWLHALGMQFASPGRPATGAVKRLARASVIALTVR